MRIIIMSDTHRLFSSIEKIVTRNIDADMFIHLGDGEEDVNLIITKYPQIASKFIHIAGNCDHNSLSPAELVIPVENHRIFAAHGHRYNVKFSLDLIKNAASEKNCDIILYGHTHVRMNLYSDGTYIMNPGSASCPNDGTKPSFGVVEICDAGVSANIADI